MPLVTKQYNLVLAKRQRYSVAAKVTVGLALHWPFITDFKQVKSKSFMENSMTQLRSVTRHRSQCYLLPDTSEHTPPSPQPHRLSGLSIYGPGFNSDISPSEVALQSLPLPLCFDELT